ncbi:MAG: adenylate/guanylate cyclase domain-containing protein [Bacteroidia bacterium]|nr:adenylate/guanylate cyclase domain-containing protein [Bacteroidia bacterium]
MPQSRRLAAIMFTDIAGYTAMMQRNEKEGLKKVHRFSEVMEANASANNGEILEFRGDGCLAVFNSAVEAMHAAKSIQESLKEEPNVPLRIGIHIGDIVFTDGNIYGDGVNLASRVESMGVPGSILVTERVIHDVKSHPEFEMASLGKFQFKNVEKPMEVFALANEGFVVPKAEQMKGKANAIDNPTDQISYSKTSMPILKSALGLVIGGLLIWGLVNFLNLGDKNEGETVSHIEKSIAVLPFRNMSNDSTQEYFSDGISEDILTNLARISDLKVIARTSSFSFRKSAKSLTEIARELGVAHILEGSVRRDKDKVRITTQLVHAESGSLLWAEEFNRSMEDIFAVQQEVAHEISRKLDAKLSSEESEVLKREIELNPEAYLLFLKARKILTNGNFSEFEHASELLETALKLAPSLSTIYSELGYYYLSRGTALGDLTPGIAKAKASPYLQKAISLDTNNSDAYVYQAYSSLWLDWDFAGAEKALEKAKKHQEEDYFASRSLLYMYAGQLGKVDTLLAELSIINPLDPHLEVMKGMSLFYKRDFQKAIQQLKYAQSLNIFEYDTYKFLAKIYLELHQYGEAIQVLENGLEQMRVNMNTPYMLAEKAIAHYKVGQRKETELIIKQLQENWNTTKVGSPAFFLGLIYANIGDSNTAFEWLEKSYEDHEVEMLWLKMDPLTKPLHDDPHYKNLLDRVGFP